MGVRFHNEFISVHTGVLKSVRKRRTQDFLGFLKNPPIWLKMLYNFCYESTDHECKKSQKINYFIENEILIHTIFLMCRIFLDQYPILIYPINPITFTIYTILISIFIWFYMFFFFFRTTS